MELRVWKYYDKSEGDIAAYRVYGNGHRWDNFGVKIWLEKSGPKSDLHIVFRTNLSKLVLAGNLEKHGADAIPTTEEVRELVSECLKKHNLDLNKAHWYNLLKRAEWPYWAHRDTILDAWEKKLRKLDTKVNLDQVRQAAKPAKRRALVRD